MPCEIVLKIYGERNSGTKYLAELAQRNLEVEVLPGLVEPSDLRTRITRRLRQLLPWLTDGLHEAARDHFFEATFAENLGWKHMNPAPERIGSEALANVRFLMVVKNPYAWLLSLYQRPYHVRGQDTRLEDLLDRYLPVMEQRENIGSEPLPPIEVWNRKVRGYLALREAARHAVIVRYEDFLADEAAALAGVAAALDIPQRGNFIPVPQGVKAADRNISHADYVNFYLQELWRDKLTPTAVRRINAELDSALAAQMGYALVDPDSLRAPERGRV